MMELGATELVLLGRESVAQADEGCGRIARHATKSQSPAQQPGEAAPNKPETFGDYELLELIARGGMGVIYRARQVNLDRRVAVKLLPLGLFSRPEAVQRLRAEALMAASLQHPNIVAVHDVGEHQGQPFYSMDFVEGRTLAQLVRDEPVSAKRAAAYLKTIAEAVHYAHQKGVLHRDLKPSNVLIDTFDQPRITDFGLAKRLEGDSELTVTGQVLGSPNFMAPEQAAGGRKLSLATDIYSLGALLYHVLTRQPPFQADSLATLLKQVVETEPVPPRRLNPGIPHDLETICLKCMEKEPGHRYATSQALADDLGRFLNGEPILARPTSTAGKFGKWCRRRPALAGMAAATLTAFVLGLAGVLWQWQRTKQIARLEMQQRYAADMHFAQLALADNNRPLALGLLDQHRPKAKSRVSGGARSGPRAETDLRGWEWRYLWQLCQGDELETLHRYGSPVTAMALSGSKDQLAVATSEVVALWDLGRGILSTNLLIPAATSLAFSPTSRILAVGTRNAEGKAIVDLWDVSSKQAFRQSTLAVGNRSLSFSPDGELLAAFDDQGKVTITELKSGQTVTNLPAQLLRSSSAGVAFAPDGSQLAIGEEYGGLRLINFKTGVGISIDTQTYCTISALAFSPDSRLLAAGFGYGDGTIQLWDTQRRELLGRMRKHTSDVTALAFTPEGSRLVSASADGTVRVWRTNDQAELCRLQSSGDGLTALTLLGDGLRLVTGDRGGAVCFWDTSRTRPSPHTNLWVAAEPVAMRDVPQEGFLPGTMDPRAVRRLGAAFTPDGLGFLATDAAGKLGQWDLQTLRLVRSFPQLGSNYWGVALSTDGRWVAAGDAAGKVVVWDWKSLQPITNFTAPFDWFGSLRFSSSGSYLIAGLARNDKRVNARIWRTADWTEIPLTGSQFGGLWCLELAPDEQTLAVGYAMGNIKLFRWPSGEHQNTLTESPGAVISVGFSADGHRLAAARFDGVVRVWDLTGRRRETALPGHLNMILGAAFSPDGRRLATGGATYRDAVKLWDLIAHRELLTLPADGHYFMQLAWSPDGNTLTATALTGMAHFWHAPSWEEIAAAEEARGRQADRASAGSSSGLQ